jgi:hypothetical protein
VETGKETNLVGELRVKTKRGEERHRHPMTELEGKTGLGCTSRLPRCPDQAFEAGPLWSPNRLLDPAVPAAHSPAPKSSRPYSGILGHPGEVSDIPQISPSLVDQCAPKIS